MYKDLPLFWRLANRATHSAAWLFLFGTGLASAFLPPSTVTSGQPIWMSVIWPLVAAIGGGVAALGVLRDRYWWESTGAFIAGAGASAYALTIWSMVAGGSITRSTQALALSALVAFIVGRAVVCATHAYRVRVAYENPPEV